MTGWHYLACPHILSLKVPIKDSPAEMFWSINEPFLQCTSFVVALHHFLPTKIPKHQPPISWQRNIYCKFFFSSLRFLKSGPSSLSIWKLFLDRSLWWWNCSNFKPWRNTINYVKKISIYRIPAGTELSFQFYRVPPSHFTLEGLVLFLQL